MPGYRIHRLRSPAPPVPLRPHVWNGAVKPRDYEPGPSIKRLPPIPRTSPAARGATRVGDLLESEDGTLRIFEFVGFEEAQWVLPEVKPELQAHSESA